MTSTPDLLCRINPLQGTSVVENFTQHATRWRQSIRRQGGYWMADFFLPLSPAVSASYLQRWFESYLAFRIQSLYAGRTAWQGIIWEMELTLDGSRRKRSMEKVQNKIRVDYVNTAGEEKSTSWYENTASQDLYGIREEIINGDATSDTEAQTEAQTKLAELSEAWVRQVAIDTDGRMESGLRVQCVGDVFTANNRFILPDVADGTTALASAYATTIIDTYCEYLTSADIETSALTVTKRLSQPTRAWEVLRLLAEMGDESGSDYRPWEVQVREGGRVHFGVAETQPYYQWTRNGLKDWGGAAASWLAWPGVLRDRTRTSGTPSPGSFLTDRRDSFVEEVEMAFGREVPSLKPAEFDENELLAAKDNYERWLETGGGSRGGSGRPPAPGSAPPGAPRGTSPGSTNFGRGEYSDWYSQFGGRTWEDVNR